MATLGQLLFAHNNNYNFNPYKVYEQTYKQKLPDLSIIIPYYNNSYQLQFCIKYLLSAVQLVEKEFSNWKFEILVIDDGSRDTPLSSVIEDSGTTRIFHFCENRGRYHARQFGLYQAKYDVCLFVDSDILIDRELILNTLKLFTFNNNVNSKNCILVSFFQFLNEEILSQLPKTIVPLNIIHDDFRLHCLYQENWIGCESDRDFVGRTIRIIKETNYFRNWHGMFMAWCLPNMVLGGFFAVSRKEALSVGGFDKRFNNYGFTETPLPTKLIALRGNYLIPIVRSSAYHVENKKELENRYSKDKYFRQAHKLFFQTYLHQEINGKFYSRLQNHEYSKT